MDSLVLRTARPARPRRHISRRLAVPLLSLLAVANLSYFIPGLVRDRMHWIDAHGAAARLAAIALQNPALGADAARRVAVLADLDGLRRIAPGGTETTLLPPPPGIVPPPAIDPARQSYLQELADAAGALADARGEIALSVPAGDGRLVLVLARHSLSVPIRRYARRFLLLSAGSLLATGVLIWHVLDTLVVAPLARIAESVGRFADDPERVPPLDPAQAGGGGGDEVACVAEAVSAMQTDLRTALWRNGRLAATGAAMAKMSHDLRGILASAMLVTERLQTSADPAARQAAVVVARAIGRAVGLVRHTLEFVREVPPPPQRAPQNLRAVAAEGCEFGAAGTPLAIVNDIDPAIECPLDHGSALRVVANLARNAAEAGARHLRLRTEGEGADLSLMLEDDGPGLPEAVQRRLFRPFVASASGGSGLGLAIARDLMWAQGGDLRLDRTGPAGTVFRLILEQHDPDSSGADCA